MLSVQWVCQAAVRIVGLLRLDLRDMTVRFEREGFDGDQYTLLRSSSAFLYLLLLPIST
jgi:hypothetical protein